MSGVEALKRNVCTLEIQRVQSKIKGRDLTAESRELYGISAVVITFYIWEKNPIRYKDAVNLVALFKKVTLVCTTSGCESTTLGVEFVANYVILHIVEDVYRYVSQYNEQYLSQLFVLMIECITVALDNCAIIHQSGLVTKMFMTTESVSLIHRDRLGAIF
ncbi:hypothetical protein H920_04078 [Fukomys damarensis]|uniref:Uncharacterized protein n=1 Tax=Fukomys damarensis TaxID=885580 RepID=A0A091DQT9_FUKDA|nr:hypothetical protein H920_04078 [Fukomys damarensis]